MDEICQTCGLPKYLCVCETIAKENQIIKIYVDKRKFGKKYTIIEGIDNKQIDIKELLKKLKSKFACGGTIKQSQIELQGEHLINAKAIMIEMGFLPETIKIIK